MPFSADVISSRLTEPSPFLSILLNTSSAWAVLVPPAPRPFSNSDLLTWPSPLVSSCENRSFRASDLLVDAEVVDPVDDWLCAASSALMVAGDICEPPPEPKGGGGGAADAEALPDRSNGFATSGVTPVFCEDDDFDEVNDLRASSADDAAPRANSMTGLRQSPRSAAFQFHID